LKADAPKHCGADDLIEETGPSGGKGWIAAIVVGVLAIIALVVFGVWYKSKKGDDNEVGLDNVSSVSDGSDTPIGDDSTGSMASGTQQTGTVTGSGSGSGSSYSGRQSSGSV